MANPKKNKTKTFLNKKSKNQEWNPNRKKNIWRIRKNAIETILTKLCTRKWSTTKNLLNQCQDASQQPRGEEAWRRRKKKGRKKAMKTKHNFFLPPSVNSVEFWFTNEFKYGETLSRSIYTVIRRKKNSHTLLATYVKVDMPILVYKATTC